MNRKILLDLETTGLSHKNGDKIIEIAAIELHDDHLIGKEYHRYINPKRSIPKEATAVHGIKDMDVANSPTFADISDEFLKFIGDSAIIAHNATFDMGFINAELAECGKDAYSEDRSIDTLKIAQVVFPGQRNRLDDLCKRFNIDNSSRKENHGALIDTRLLAEVYIKLLSEKNKDYGDSLRGHSKDSEVLLKDYKTNFPKRSFPLSELEEANHKEFVKSINGQLWLKQ